MRTPFVKAWLLAGPSLVFVVVPAQAQSDVDQRLRVIERKLEIEAEEKETRAKDATGASAGEKGFSLKSATGDYELKVRALVQLDGRFFVQDDTRPSQQNGTVQANDSFLLRRLRPTFEGTAGSLIGLRLTPEFAGDGAGLAASIVDAYIDLKFHPAASVRAGKQKGSVGLERLQSGGAISFAERGLPTELVPNRDVGVALFGEFAGGVVGYTLGVFNGTADGRDVSGPDADSREAAARLFLEPFRDSPGVLQGLGFGVGATYGNKFSTVATTPAAGQTVAVAGANAANANAVLPRYRTPGQNQFFSYSVNSTGINSGTGAAVAPSAADTVTADGDHLRYAPQLYWYYNRFGLLGEYALSEQSVSLAGAGREFQHQAYGVTASVVLTGEDAGFRGVTRPNRPWAAGGNGRGALEFAARAGALDVDDGVFDEVIPGATTAGGTFARKNASATSAASASRATACGVGFNWYLTSNAKLVLDYDRTEFVGGGAAGSAPGTDRETEQVVFTRVQLTY